MRALIVVAVAAIAVAGCKSEEQKHQQWTCPMHPQYVSDKPGDCPICGMRLVPKKRGAPAAPSGARTGSDGGAPGYSQVTIDPEHQRLIGLTTTEVTLGPIPGGLRTTGKISFDERRIEKVTARFEGYVEKLYADFTGKLVQKGDPLVSIYSPELLSTEEEYLLARASQATLTQSGLPNAANAARDRLKLFGIPESEIARLEKRGTAERALTLHAPISGFITTKNVVGGARVQPNDPLFEIVDLSKVWVMADVYENELPRLRLGQRATLTLSYWPDKKWQGRVSYILPTVDDKTRTVKVRIEVDNPNNELKPEMFADVVIDTAPRQALVVPDGAVIVTGTRKLVFLAVGQGHLLPREIETGAHVDGRYEVKAGLRAGDKVAAGASFLLDSEARLRSAVSQ
jgi:Cu(I)/Ag(I) efflux system membrane fusion protein